ncbi:HlyC/CorC family transporter [bacterium]|nr:HlyC/CorC family transporter [candidate division CSSED10-310 bacterium]
MDPDITYIFLLLIFSAFFSGSESALFSLQWWHYHRFRQSDKPIMKTIVRIMDHPHRILATILLGNTLVNVAASAIAASYFERVTPVRGLWISIVFMTAVLIVLGEIIPKTLSIYHAETISRWVAGPIVLMSRILWPVRIVLEKIGNWADRVTSLSGRVEHAEERDVFLNVLAEARKQGILSIQERSVAEKILEMDDLPVSQVMIPRTEVVALPETVGYEEAIQRMRRENLRRVPLYRETIDRIVGILYVKDLLPGRFDPNRKKSPRTIARTPYFVPGSMKIKQLYTALRQKQMHLAVVLDEYGGTAGLVSHDDLLLTLLASVTRRDPGEPDLAVPTDSGFRVSGQADLEFLARKGILKIPDTEFRTLNGFLLERFERIPDEGSELTIPGATIRIVKTSPTRIEQVEILPRVSGEKES